MITRLTPASSARVTRRFSGFTMFSQKQMSDATITSKAARSSSVSFSKRRVRGVTSTPFNAASTSRNGNTSLSTSRAVTRALKRLAQNTEPGPQPQPISSTRERFVSGACCR